MRVTGWVRDRETNQPLKNAQVTGVVGGRPVFETRTTDQGRFQYVNGRQLVGQKILLRVERPGYQAYESEHLITGGELSVDVRLSGGPKPKEHGPAPIRITGFIRDAGTKQPLKNATITLSVLSEELSRSETDESGRYDYTTSKQQYVGQSLRIHAERDHYQPAEVSRTLVAYGLSVDLELTRVLEPVRPPLPWQKIAAVVGALLLLSVVYFLVMELIGCEEEVCTQRWRESVLERNPAPQQLYEAGLACQKEAKGPDDQERLGSAVRFLRSAADSGLPGAMVALGEMYDPAPITPHRAQQQPADYRLAFNWYEQALAQGNPAARDRLRQLKAYVRSRADQNDMDALELLNRWPE